MTESTLQRPHIPVSFNSMGESVESPLIIANKNSNDSSGGAGIPLSTN